MTQLNHNGRVFKIEGAGRTIPVYVGIGRPATQVGLVAPEGGPYLLAIEMPKEAPDFLGVEAVSSDVYAEHNPNDPDAALRNIQASLAASQAIDKRLGEMALPARPGAYVAGIKNKFQFRVTVNSSHHKIASDPAKYNTRSGAALRQTLKLKTWVLELRHSEDNGLRWEDGPALNLILDIMELEVFPRAFAIDLGTTNTCAAYMDGDPASPRLYKIQESLSIPTLVRYKTIIKRGERTFDIGLWAERVDAEGDLRKFVRGMKRYIGLSGEQNLIQVYVNDTIHYLTAEEAYADFLEKYLESFKETHKKKLEIVKATYPPDMREGAKRAIEDLYATCGIRRDRLFGVDEASAAAVYYIWRRLENAEFNLDIYRARWPDAHNLLVFDLGGGTTDVSMVRVTVEQISEKNILVNQIKMKVLGAASLLNVGGDNFTLALFKAIKCRIAVAAAKCLKETGLKELQPGSVRTSLEEIADNLSHFQQVLSPPKDAPPPASEEALQESLAEIEKLAEQVLPTAWARFGRSEDGIEEDVFARGDAINTFFGLWKHAEHYKKQICQSADGTVKLERSRIATSGRYDQAFANLKLPPTEWDKITLNIEDDFYRRIRFMLLRAARACRQVTLSDQGIRHEVDSIQLVGNSCRIELVRKLMIEEFSEIPLIKERIEFDPNNAKSSVAMGACLASHLNDFGRSTRVRMKFDPLEERLGVDIGEWDKISLPFTVFFESTVKPSTSPYVDLPDDPDRTELKLYQRRRGDEGDPERIGNFTLTEKPDFQRGVPAAPNGVLRLKLISPSKMTLQRGQQFWQFHLDRPIKIVDDPFCGEH